MFLKICAFDQNLFQYIIMITSKGTQPCLGLKEKVLL